MNVVFCLAGTSGVLHCTHAVLIYHDTKDRFIFKEQKKV